MVKKQINFRIDERTLEKIKAEAKRQGKSYTRWMIDAALMRLSTEKMAFDETQITDEEQEIKELKKQLTALWSTLDHYGFRIEEIEEQQIVLEGALRAVQKDFYGKELLNPSEDESN